jgi:transposase
MAKRRYTLRDKLVTLSQAYTQKQIAKQLGVSDRTIRRWKNEGVKPAVALPEIRGSLYNLQASFERERKRLTKMLREDRRKHPGAPKLDKVLRILPPGHRRKLREYKAGRETGKKRDSEWINYDTAKLDFDEIFQLVQALRDEGRIVQLIYHIPKGARYPRDSRGRVGKPVSKPVRVGTPPLDLSNMDDGDLQEFLLRYVDAEYTSKSRRIVYVSALDFKPRS